MKVPQIDDIALPIISEESKNPGLAVEGSGEQIHISNDKQIMDDLDRIINNLEAQQKNLATFGLPADKTSSRQQTAEKRFLATEKAAPGDGDIAIPIEGTRPRWETTAD